MVSRYVQQQNVPPVHGKTDPQVIGGGAFAHTALLICYAYYVGFRYFGIPSFSISLAASVEQAVM